MYFSFQLQVYELYSGREREEIILMAMYSACYYLMYMILAKYPTRYKLSFTRSYRKCTWLFRAPTLTIEAVYELRQLKEVV